MEASLCLQVIHLATWRPKGLLASHRHVAVVPNGRAVEMSPRHLVCAGALARELACGGGGWRRIDKWRRPLTSNNHQNPCDNPVNPGNDPVLDVMLRVLLRILKEKKDLNDNEDEFNQIHTKVKEPVNSDQDDMKKDSKQMLSKVITEQLIYECDTYKDDLRRVLGELKTQQLIDESGMEKDPKQMIGTIITEQLRCERDLDNDDLKQMLGALRPQQLIYEPDINKDDLKQMLGALKPQQLIYEPHALYEKWVRIKSGDTQYNLGLLLALLLNVEKDFIKALKVRKCLPEKSTADARPYLLDFIICISRGMESMGLWKVFMRVYEGSRPTMEEG